MFLLNPTACSLVKLQSFDFQSGVATGKVDLDFFGLGFPAPKTQCINLPPFKGLSSRIPMIIPIRDGGL